MRHRCLHTYTPNYANYGGRGITICARWDDFVAFLEDMGPRPSPWHTLERLDSNGNYEPSNCRWATQAEQMRNTSRNVWVVLRGERMVFKDACSKLGIHRSQFVARRRKCDDTPQQCIDFYAGGGYRK